MVNIGFGNLVNENAVVAILSPDSAPAKRRISYAREHNQLIDATQGRRTKSLLFTNTDQLIISAMTPETLQNRFCQAAKNMPNQSESED